MPQKLTDVNPQPNNCSHGDVEASINPTIYMALDGENRVNLQGVPANGEIKEAARLPRSCNPHPRFQFQTWGEYVSADSPTENLGWGKAGKLDEPFPSSFDALL